MYWLDVLNNFLKKGSGKAKNTNSLKVPHTEPQLQKSGTTKANLVWGQ